MNRNAARNLRQAGIFQASAAWTLTPLIGFIFGDHRPSLAASVLHMIGATIVYLVGAAPLLRDRSSRDDPAPSVEEALPSLADLRAQTLAAGLPWVDKYGRIVEQCEHEADPDTCNRCNVRTVHVEMHERAGHPKAEVTFAANADPVTISASAPAPPLNPNAPRAQWEQLARNLGADSDRAANAPGWELIREVTNEYDRRHGQSPTYLGGDTWVWPTS